MTKEFGETGEQSNPRPALNVHVDDVINDTTYTIEATLNINQSSLTDDQLESLLNYMTNHLREQGINVSEAGYYIQ